MRRSPTSTEAGEKLTVSWVELYSANLRRPQGARCCASTLRGPEPKRGDLRRPGANAFTQYLLRSMPVTMRSSILGLDSLLDQWCCAVQVIVYLLGRATATAAPGAAPISGGGAQRQDGAAQPMEAGQQDAAEGEDMALAHLRIVAALLEQYFHPSNNGRCALCNCSKDLRHMRKTSAGISVSCFCPPR